jgi:nucleoside-diphosphate-sugar epimerase
VEGTSSLPLHVFTYKERFETFQAIAETYDLVFHLAASLTKHNIDERNKMGMEAFSDNQLDWEVARYLEDHKPRERVVWMSSCATDAKDTEVYAFCKYVSERYARHLGRHGFPIAILKPFGGYGPGQSLNYPFPAILERALRKDDPLCVWGNAHTTRDWVYIDDLIDAILLAADGKFPNAGAIAIGTGRPTTFKQLAEMIAAQVGYSPEIKADFTKPVGSSRRVAETSVAKMYGFNAKVTLEEGIARCIAAARKGMEHEKESQVSR